MPTRRFVGVYPGTTHAVVAAIDLLDAEGTAGGVSISAEALA